MVRAADNAQAETGTEAGIAPEPAELSERNQRILEMERNWWRYAGAKETAIREQFDMSATRYYQLLNELIDTEAALKFDPMVVKRLRRQREQRRRLRSQRRLGMNV